MIYIRSIPVSFKNLVKCKTKYLFPYLSLGKDKTIL